jgi:hypothetical protein
MQIIEMKSMPTTLASEIKLSHLQWQCSDSSQLLLSQVLEDKPILKR